MIQFDDISYNFWAFTTVLYVYAAIFHHPSLMVLLHSSQRISCGHFALRDFIFGGLGYPSSALPSQAGRLVGLPMFLSMVFLLHQSIWKCTHLVGIHRHCGKASFRFVLQLWMRDESPTCAIVWPEIRSPIPNCILIIL